MPHAGVLFDLARDVGLHVFGASAKYYATLEKQGYKAPQLLELRAILSTGSPLLPSSFDYIHTAIKDNIPIGILIALLSNFCLFQDRLRVYFDGNNFIRQF